MIVTENIIITLPKDAQLSKSLFSLLSNCGVVDGAKFIVRSSNPDYLPVQEIEFADVAEPSICFDSVDGQLTQRIINETGEDKESPHTYQLLPIDEIRRRLDGLGQITKIDHLGVNFPWFDGLSPILDNLRDELKGESAYYLFPEGQPWDFILPTTKEELESGSIDLSKERRPKLELVSFEKTSKPLIQIDCITTASYTELKSTFPEGIGSDELYNVWVYIETSMDIDLCLVLNEKTDQDWSSFFEGYRLR